ncbi:exo-beta-N-acetylmuramidase NamZ family protein [Paenibacillus eucommiae]|uniref:Uncharacterized protein YbbC (DUF1343 family) n=1 Tax=Paenibacillus eucommiae TaxID=1355755 RepID=A0ABS4IZY4_9BACL|nr:DUF1343 domain-containing protein [Paenibacillus eucommiae]MBP1993147.1 uncharacterized protein YbbC (DUF1343 family) [Paenibacillus eucommiae]
MNKQVLVGADQLPAIGGKLLRGKRFAILTNPTGVDSRFRSTIDLCKEIEGAELAACFACEHGLRNEKQAGVLFEDEIDPEYGIPVYSLYGTNRKPTAEMLRDIDVVIFDIQDLGIRFYTYLTTLIYTMQACAENKVALIVLDRPNPLGGNRIEGGILQERFFSMVGLWKMPVMTGMTIGEFARLVNGQMEVSCDLQVVPLEGWNRSMEFTDTGLPWIMPSPNMPTIDTVRVYAGNCVFEGTNVSEGRGTTKPFEMVGAPWLKHNKLCDAMNDMKLPGVWFQPVTFSPSFKKHTGVLCNGVMTYVTDRTQFQSTETGLRLLHQIMTMHPDDFQWVGSEDGNLFIDILTGSDIVRTTLHEPGALEAIIANWRKDSAEWEQTRKPYLLYEETGATVNG